MTHTPFSKIIRDQEEVVSQKIIIFGIGKMGQLAHFYFSQDTCHEVVAFTIDREYINDSTYLGLPIVPFDDVVNQYPPAEYKMFVAIGYTNLNTVRAEKYFMAKNLGYTFVSYFSSKITHWQETQIGENCFILENQIFQPFVKIGNNVVIWGGNHFGHDVEIGDHCWIAAHVVLSGGVTIGDYSFVGVNATFRDNVKIGCECIIGAGAIMLRNAEDKQVFISKPTELYPLDSERFEKMMSISR